MADRIIVIVSGGLVQNVKIHSDREVVVEIHDYDVGDITPDVVFQTPDEFKRDDEGDLFSYSEWRHP